ncbi:uncharacterized protein LOC123315968 [Coccinella septempunctata]|uniref:uncharacterized protein LOC123315968 n=1 Tax=Coccinella septempunctata TaxID=41139 RepID=UPI001D099942|nr:uncharacterized protein LOC123315968 [Coccinella septempunctata]
MMGNSMMAIMSRMMSMPYSFYNSVESRMWIGSIFYQPCSTISFFQGVCTFHMISISMFPLGFNVMGVRIMNAVTEFIMCRRWANSAISTTTIMNSFVIAFLVFVAVISALPHHEHHAPTHYKFEYGVHDPHTHDVKSQWEHRDGDNVKGAYTLKEADGTTRLVEYTAGPHTGFNAVVKRIGHAHHPAHYGHHGGAHHGGHGGDSFVGVTHWGFHY